MVLCASCWWGLRCGMGCESGGVVGVWAVVQEANAGTPIPKPESVARALGGLGSGTEGQNGDTDSSSRNRWHFSAAADQQAFHHIADALAFPIFALLGDAEGIEDAVAKTHVDEDPGDEFGGEDTAEFLVFLREGQFAGEELVELGEVPRDGFLDLVVIDFGDGLKQDAILLRALVRHRVVAQNAAEAFGRIVDVGEAVFPMLERAFGGAMDERDEEVALAGKVSIDDGLGDAGHFCELGSGRARVAAASEELESAIEQLLLAFGGR